MFLFRLCILQTACIPCLGIQLYCRGIIWPMSNVFSPVGARHQSMERSLIRCSGVFYLYLTAYTVVRQEVPDDHALKDSPGKTQATQGRFGSDQRSPSRLSHRPVSQVW